MCSSPYHQSGLETLLPLPNALRSYENKTNPDIQHRQEIRRENQVLALKDNYRLLSVRRSTINPAENFDTVIERAHVLHT